MSKPKFTPGPWKAHHGVYEPDYVFYGEEENCDREKRVIAEVYQRVGFQSYDVDLIAAAPEMYDFLEKLVNQIEENGLTQYDSIHNGENWVLEDAKELLHKARGESEVE